LSGSGAPSANGEKKFFGVRTNKTSGVATADQSRDD